MGEWRNEKCLSDDSQELRVLRVISMGHGAWGMEESAWYWVGDEIAISMQYAIYSQFWKYPRMKHPGGTDR